MWANFHSHSKYCDGKGELADYIAAAKAQKVFSIGFSSHGPLPFKTEWTMNKESVPSYFKDIEQLRLIHSDIEIYKSLELDFIPGVVSPFEYKDELDYLLGAVHFVDQFADGRRWEIDGSHTVFLDGLKNIFKDDIKAVISRYFELIREMIFASAPDVIAHLDKIKIQSEEGKLFNENERWYRDEVEKTLHLIDQAELIVEVNTRGIYQKKSATTYPSPWILEMIQKKNIPVVLCSDAHHPDDLTNSFTTAAKMLRQLGFKTLSVMTEGKWRQLPFDEHGISR